MKWLDIKGKKYIFERDICLLCTKKIKFKSIFEFNDLEASSKEAHYPLAPISPGRPLERNKKK